MPADEVSHRRPEGSRERSPRAATSAGDPGRAAAGPGSSPTIAADGSGQRFRRSQRLLERRDFERVLRLGRRRSLPELVVVTSAPGERGRLRCPEERGGVLQNRLGITVGRKAGSSVERNRFKRRVREWFRQQQTGLGGPVDIVVIARRPAVDLSFGELALRLARLTHSAGGQVPGKHQEIHKS